MTRNRNPIGKWLGLAVPLVPLALVAGLAWRASVVQRESLEQVQDIAYGQRLASEITESALRAQMLSGNQAAYSIALEHAGFALGAIEEMPRAAAWREETGLLGRIIAEAGSAEKLNAKQAALARLEQATATLDIVMADSLESEGLRVAATYETLRWLTAAALLSLLVVMLRDRLALVRQAAMRLRMQMPGGPAVLQLVSGSASAGYRLTPKRRWR